MTFLTKEGFFVPSNENVKATLGMRDVIKAVERGLSRFALTETIARSSIATTGGELLIMPAVSDSVFGVKLVTVAPKNPNYGRPRIQGVYVFFDQETQNVVAMFDASVLTEVRTAAFSGWVTDKMAPATSSRLLVFGAGPQARAHIEAMRTVREIEEVRIVSRRQESAQLLADEIATTEIPALVGSSLDQEWADIICCCTSSGVPILNGDQIRSGTHINAVGSHNPDRRELDSKTVARARLVVESRPAALTEAGDLLLAIQDGSINAQHIEFDLRELALADDIEARTDTDLTVFKSVGVGFEDLLVAEHIVSTLIPHSP